MTERSDGYCRVPVSNPAHKPYRITGQYYYLYNSSIYVSLITSNILVLVFAAVSRISCLSLQTFQSSHDGNVASHSPTKAESSLYTYAHTYMYVRMYVCVYVRIE